MRIRGKSLNKARYVVIGTQEMVVCIVTLIFDDKRGGPEKILIFIMQIHAILHNFSIIKRNIGNDRKLE